MLVNVYKRYGVTTAGNKTSAAYIITPQLRLHLFDLPSHSPVLQRPRTSFKMNAVSICAPMRTAMLRGRISPAALASPKTPFQVRMGSTTSTRTTTPTIQPSMLLQTSPRPQNNSLPASCVLRSTVRANSASSAPPTNEAKLDWNSFFKLRATRRRYSVASSAVTSVVTTVFGVQYLSTQDIESLGAQVMGLDPIVVLGISTMACGAAGWLLGPFVGNGLWSLVNRKYTAAFARVSNSSTSSGHGC